MPMSIKIYTEDKNRDQVEEIVRDYFSSFNISSLTGVYCGKSEKGLVIEIITFEPSQADTLSVSEIAHRIKETNKQEEVLVTRCYVDIVRY